MKRTNNNTNTNKTTEQFTWKWTSPIASMITFFTFKPVTPEELSETLDSCSKTIAISKKNIEEADQLLKEIKLQIKHSEDIRKQQMDTITNYKN